MPIIYLFIYFEGKGILEVYMKRKESLYSWGKKKETINGQLKESRLYNPFWLDCYLTKRG